MSSEKQNYVKRIRRDSVYPTYRLLTTIMGFLGYLIALVPVGYAIYLVYQMYEMEEDNVIEKVVTAVIGFLVTIVGVFIVRVWLEAITMLVDMVDSIIDSNCSSSVDADTETSG